MSLLTSITSTNLRKIVIPTRLLHPWFGVDDPSSTSYYAIVDNSLCQLVERLQGFGYKHRLVVVFNLWQGDIYGHEEMDFEELFPRFRERGRVKVVDGPNDRAVYCSN